MKILLSAYACEPNKGSEPGVGWQWMCALARRGYEVYVITRSNNRPAIEGSEGRLRGAVRFHYYDLPKWLRFWKRWPGGIYLYYLLWQAGAYRLAKRLHARERFDLVHHVTFVSYRQPSFMGGLGIPFIFGPVGGGEEMPRALREGLPRSGRIAEMVRTAGNRMVRLDPLMQYTYTTARMIACTTDETMRAIPARFHGKCIVQRAIGIEASEIRGGRTDQAGDLRFLFIGRLLYWKGLHLALKALPEVRREIPNIKLRVIGEGEDRDWLHKVARRAGVEEMVEWIERKPHDEIRLEYQKSVGFVFPSLHDSGGMVVIEALAAGLPVICLKLGGPGSVVTTDCGMPVDASGRSEEQVVGDLASAMVRLALRPELREWLSEGAVRRARELTWDAAADAVYARVPTPEHVGVEAR